MAEKSATSTTFTGRREGRDAGARQGAEGVRAPQRGPGGGRTRPAREDRGDAGTGSRHGRADSCRRQGQRAGPRAEDLVRDARYARDGKVVCFFKSADKFKSRYATLGFEEDAHLDDGTMWATSWALTRLTDDDEARIGALVKKAVG